MSLHGMIEALLLTEIVKILYGKTNKESSRKEALV